MITGFNTDIRHGGLVFHVQTEDKGTGNPCVESLVYVGGQILARKRSGYRTLLDEDEPSKAITELMERQHQTLIKAIRAGKLDEKVNALPNVQFTQPTIEPAPSPPSESEPDPAAPTEGEEPTADEEPAAEAPVNEVAPPPDVDDSGEPGRFQFKSTSPRPSISSTDVPETPPAVRPAKSGDEEEDRSLDQVILDYLEMESDQERLVLSMDNTGGEVAMGQSTTLLFHAESSLDADPIGKARITVRLISTADEPQVVGEGETDDHGTLALEVSIPSLNVGTAALIVTAESSIGNAELRRLI